MKEEECSRKMSDVEPFDSRTMMKNQKMKRTFCFENCGDGELKRGCCLVFSIRYFSIAKIDMICAICSWRVIKFWKLAMAAIVALCMLVRVAQAVEHLICIQGVVGSTPITYIHFNLVGPKKSSTRKWDHLERRAWKMVLDDPIHRHPFSRRANGFCSWNEAEKRIGWPGGDTWKMAIRLDECKICL